MRILPIALVALSALLLLVASETLTAPRLDGSAGSEPRGVIAATPLDTISLREIEALAATEDSLQRALERDGRDVDALAALARLYLREGAYSAATAALERAIRIAPDRDDLRRQLRVARSLAGPS